MAAVLLVIHLMIAASLIGVVLLQRSEGGALGIGGGGGGGGGGGFMTGRGTANLLTRVTAVLALGFFITSILLTIMARHDMQPKSVLDQAAPVPATSKGPATKTPTPPTSGRGGILDRLQKGRAPQVPQPR